MQQNIAKSHFWTKTWYVYVISCMNMHFVHVLVFASILNFYTLQYVCLFVVVVFPCIYEKLHFVVHRGRPRHGGGNWREAPLDSLLFLRTRTQKRMQCRVYMRCRISTFTFLMGRGGVATPTPTRNMSIPFRPGRTTSPRQHITNKASTLKPKC